MPLFPAEKQIIRESMVAAVLVDGEDAIYACDQVSWQAGASPSHPLPLDGWFG